MIAIIDDDEGMRVSLDGLLRSLGHRTELFDSAEAFLESQSAGTADCVISDIHMPGGMSGIDLARRLGDDRPPMPVILMSAFADKDVRERAEDTKVHCLLAKPFDEETLIACLEKALVV
ncbi:response regulator transcription factor [Neorhizobium galegae]|uniref:response regulator transcription factor n=1 Tax=Neorhizobium galegae TaxID=399 RepID=UPI001AED4F01|nr:response regulator [Neorhizobium galegae]